MKCLVLRGFLLIGDRARTRKNAAGKADGAQGRNRTTDTAIFVRMLHELSYGHHLPMLRTDAAGVPAASTTLPRTKFAAALGTVKSP